MKLFSTNNLANALFAVAILACAAALARLYF